MAVASIVGLLVIVVVLSAIVAGVILLVRGLRGVPEFSEPRCAKCGYDLRGFAAVVPTVCSECGADLAKASAVRWGAYRRRPRAIWAGLALLALPLVLVASLTVAQTRISTMGGPPVQAGATNAALIASVATQGNDYFIWQDLESRYGNGGLSNAEVAQAIDGLIAHLTGPPSRTGGPLFWSEGFVKRVTAAGAVTEAQYQRLADVFYGVPTLHITSAVRKDRPVLFDLSSSNPWNLPYSQHVMAVREVCTVGGHALPITAADGEDDPFDPGARLDRLSLGPDARSVRGRIDLSALPPGKHELTFVVDVGILKEGTAPQVVGHRPGQARHWPKGRGRLVKEVVATVTVVPSSESPITPITAAAVDPASQLKATIRVVGGGDEGTHGRITLYENNLATPISADVSVRIAGHEHPSGGAVLTPGGSATPIISAVTTVRLPQLARDVLRADILLRPNFEHAEQVAGLNAAWAKEIELKDVPLERYDPQAQAAQDAATLPAR